MTHRIAAAFAGHDKRAALMPYLMGGYPDLEESRAAAGSGRRRRGRPDRAGHPVLDPLADGPVIYAAGTRRRWRTAPPRTASSRSASGSRSGCRWC